MDPVALQEHAALIRGSLPEPHAVKCETAKGKHDAGTWCVPQSLLRQTHSVFLYPNASSLAEDGTYVVISAHLIASIAVQCGHDGHAAHGKVTSHAMERDTGGGGR